MGLRWGLGLFDSLLKRLWFAWGMRSLSAKLLVANAVVIMLSLLLSAAAYMGGSALMRNRLLKHQIGTDALAAVREGGGAVTSTLNKRMETVQDCFDLAIIQVYEHQGQMKTELIVYGSPGESPLLNLTEPHRSSGLRAVVCFF